MKTHFPGYFPPNEKEKKELWDTAFFSFDANILLGLYRYSDDTKDRFLELLERIKDRCWIPHQVAKEFLRNRLEVIKEQADAYDKASSELDTVAAKFAGEHRHPFLPERTFKQLSDSIEAVKADLANSKARHLSRLDEDDIFKKFEEIFGNRVGMPFTEKELSDIQKEGEDRYQRKVPPGYKDASKNDPTDPTRRFGDLLVWKQLIAHAKLRNSGVIFICDDRKEDWWSDFNGKTLGPRPALVKEFSDECKSSLLFYRPHRFLEFAAKHFDTEVPSNAVTEIKEAIAHPTEEKPVTSELALEHHDLLNSLLKRKTQLQSKLRNIQANILFNSNEDRIGKWLLEHDLRATEEEIFCIDIEISEITDS